MGFNFSTIRQCWSWRERREGCLSIGGKETFQVIIIWFSLWEEGLTKKCLVSRFNQTMKGAGLLENPGKFLNLENLKDS